jgi:hypothetical protein
LRFGVTSPSITSREIGDSDRGSPNGKIGGGILAGSYLAQNLCRLSPCFVRSQRTRTTTSPGLRVGTS